MSILQLTLIGSIRLLLQACTTSGNPSIKEETEASINEKIQQGVTSKDEVNTMLGDPLEATFSMMARKSGRMNFRALRHLPATSSHT